MKISALDEDGKAVDWWFAYKVPKLIQTSAGGIIHSAEGYEYAYYDTKLGQVIISKNTFANDEGALHLTLDSVFKHPDATTGWILYNDEMPQGAGGKDKGSLGHTKGVIAFDTASNSGYWLLHSWPKYVDPSAAAMPTPMYGQTFLCITLDVATANQIAAMMSDHQQPQIFLPRMPASLPKTDPLFKITQGLTANPPGESGTIDCVSKGGMKFKVIAKNREWNKDFWNDLVGPTLQSDMDVDTWIRGPIAPVLDSDGIHKTFDIKFIDLRPLGAEWAWPEQKDHAKWGITYENNWVCVGDINRMISQEKRGGGTIALQDEKLWAALKKTDFLVPPPGLTKEEATAILQDSHGDSKAKIRTSHRAKPKAVIPKPRRAARR